MLMQTGHKRDPRLPDTPLLSDLMDEFKTADLGRRVVTVMLGSAKLRGLIRHPSGDAAGSHENFARSVHEEHGRSGVVGRCGQE